MVIWFKKLLYAPYTIALLMISTDTIADVCDSSLVSASGELGYHMRDMQRCEGLHEVPYSSRFKLLSFTSLNNYQQKKNYISLYVPSHPKFNNKKAFIEVNSIAAGSNYRLDAVAKTGTIFSWPSVDVLEKVGLSEADLGYIAWVEYNDNKYYMPVGVNPTKGRANTAGHTVTIRTPFSLEKVMWRMYKEKTNRDIQKLWKHTKKQRISPNELISIEIPRKQGDYIVEVYGKPINRDIPVSKKLYIISN